MLAALLSALVIGRIAQDAQVPAAEDSYGYPYADPCVATVIGTPKELNAEAPVRIHASERKVTVFEDRPVPDILRYGRKLRYSVAPQGKEAALIFLIPGMGEMVADGDTGRLLGVQCVGPGDVGKQVATATMALLGNLTVSDLVNADLPYTPPFSLAIDHFIATAHIMENKLKGRLNGIGPVEFKQELDAGKPPYILDVRTPQEFDMMRIGIGETLIPIGDLRRRLDDLPKDKDREIVCFCKISLRGYEAALILESEGWKNVRVLESGVMAWPYRREK